MGDRKAPTPPPAAPAPTFSGVLTLHNWTMMADGQVYQYVFASQWEIVPDKHVEERLSLGRFRSQEGFSVVGYGDGPDPLVWIPGCQVKGWAYCEQSPQVHGAHAVYDLSVVWGGPDA